MPSRSAASVVPRPLALAVLLLTGAAALPGREGVPQAGAMAATELGGSVAPASDGWTPVAGEAPTADTVAVELPPVQYLTVLVGDERVPLAFRDVSPVLANGRTALLVHDQGEGESGDRWDATARALAGAGYRVIVPDLVGHGRSGPAAALPTADVLAGHLAVLLDSLGAPSASVVGTTPDADVVRRLAVRWPAVVAREAELLAAMHD